MNCPFDEGFAMYGTARSRHGPRTPSRPCLGARRVRSLRMDRAEQ